MTISTASGNFDVISLKQDEYKAVLPENHPLTKKDLLDYEDLNDQPFLLLERGGKHKPWQDDYKNPFGMLYLHYLNLTMRKLKENM